MSPSYELFFNPEQNRWTVMFDGQPYGLHCGEGFDLILGYYYLNCTLEFGDCWFIIAEGVRFNLNKKERYQVIL